MCRILRRKFFWAKCFVGLLRLQVQHSKRVSKEPDHKGRIAVWHVNIYLQRRNGDPADPDYIVLEAYCGMTAQGEITGSGLLDPKDIVTAGINYCQLSKAAPACQLCESGDMIPMEERFVNARYRPNTLPFSPTRSALSKARKQYNYWRDRMEQNLVLVKYRATMKP
jgi:hypothetical protein